MSLDLMITRFKDSRSMESKAHSSMREVVSLNLTHSVPSYVFLMTIALVTLYCTYGLLIVVQNLVETLEAMIQFQGCVMQ
jgi:hypothetical protein